MNDAVVTGIGVTAPNGVGAAAYWDATLRGVSGIRQISRFDAGAYPVRLAGEVPSLGDEARIPGKLLPQTDRVTRMALVAADLAFTDAGVDPRSLPEYSAGVATSCTSGGLEFGQGELAKLWGRGWEHVSAYMSFAWYYAVNAGQISIMNELRGPGGVLISEQTGGLDSLGFARRQVRKGTAMMVTGGIEATLCPYGVAILASARELSSSPDPERAYLPFDADAAGYVPGEGGAIFVVEDRERAEARGAWTYGSIAGYGAAFDPDTSSGCGLLRAARVALDDARVIVDDVDVVFADAAGTPALDEAECATLTALFGPRGVPVSVPKTMTGRLSSGGSALDVAAALLSMRDGVIPPAVHVRRDTVDARIDLIAGAPRRAALDVALVLSRGRGGFASAVVLSKGGGRR
ncbi:MAG: beta-ketoacyl synthase [Mycobacterium sp.]|nr:beta-ketoacyl synthase [Mycobacterium sp.]